MLKVLELFGGIGACTRALHRLKIDYEIADYVEIDKYAVKSYNAINNKNFEPQDITKWDKKIDVDLIMHGSPCQDFSIAGKQAGGDENSGTRSSLMYETLRIIKKLKPKYVIWENVANLLSEKHKHNFDNYIIKMCELGYTSYYQVLNAKDYGIPQNRERIFTISIRKDLKQFYIFPPKQELKLKLKDMLENEVDEKYYLSNTGIQLFLKQAKKRGENLKEYEEKRMLTIAHGQSKGSNRNLEISPTLDTKFSNCWRGVILEPKILIKNATKKGYDEAKNGDSINLAYPNSETRRGRVGKGVSQTLQCNDNMGVVENLRIRKLTPKECWRLMGFDDEDFEKAKKVNSNAQLYKQAGNSIVVNVLEAILYNLLCCNFENRNVKDLLNVEQFTFDDLTI